MIPSKHGTGLPEYLSIQLGGFTIGGLKPFSRGRCRKHSHEKNCSRFLYLYPSRCGTIFGGVTAPGCRIRYMCSSELYTGCAKRSAWPSKPFRHIATIVASPRHTQVGAVGCPTANQSGLLTNCSDAVRRCAIVVFFSSHNGVSYGKN